MATDIPKAREIIEKRIEALMADGAFAHAETIGDLRDALSLMTRKTNKRPARVSAPKITDEVIYGVLAVYEAYPDLAQREIGKIFGIDGGRVSEIINGLRTPQSPDMPGDGFSEVLREAMSRAHAADRRWRNSQCRR